MSLQAKQPQAWITCDPGLHKLLKKCARSLQPCYLVHELLPSTTAAARRDW